MSIAKERHVKQDIAVVSDLQDRIFTIRGEKVILDSDLAGIYGVETKRLNEQVRRNADRFPLDFAFELTEEEADQIKRLRSQFATLKRGQHRKYLPRVFTEHGALMAANVLNSKRAVEMSVFVVRAFTKMRTALSDTRELAHKLASLEREVKSRLDSHDAAIVDVMQRILDLIDPPEHPAPPPPPRQIGFSVKESSARYATRRRKGANRVCQIPGEDAQRCGEAVSCQHQRRRSCRKKEEAEVSVCDGPSTIMTDRILAAKVGQAFLPAARPSPESHSSSAPAQTGMSAPRPGMST